nr:uncharacterized protein LOC112730214 [Arachis hypogaea]
MSLYTSVFVLLFLLIPDSKKRNSKKGEKNLANPLSITVVILSFSPSSVTRSILHRACSTRVFVPLSLTDPLHPQSRSFSDRRRRNTPLPQQGSAAAPQHSGPPFHWFLSPFCLYSSPATLIFVLLPQPLSLRPTPLRWEVFKQQMKDMLHHSDQRASS